MPLSGHSQMPHIIFFLFKLVQLYTTKTIESICSFINKRNISNTFFNVFVLTLIVMWNPLFSVLYMNSTVDLTPNLTESYLLFSEPYTNSTIE